MPVVAALSSGTAAGAKLETLLGGSDALSDHELAFAADLIEDAGGGLAEGRRCGIGAWLLTLWLPPNRSRPRRRICWPWLS
ncbi:hypothetical protein MMRN_55790 [Mycobacterium marinum]|nr:hypothetical protein MMRN_55790 [Mycobacterium marinum]